MGWLWPSAADVEEEEVDEELRDERAKVAFHESGHVIACDRLGIAYTEIHVSVGRTYWTGQMRSEGHVWTPEGTYRETDLAIMSLSGMTAEALYYMEQGWSRRKAWDEAESHSGTDLRHAHEYVGRRGISQAERAARRLIESRWSDVSRLAVTL